MRRSLAIVALAAMSSVCGAVTCSPPGEYAELKDQAAKVPGRMVLAYDACTAQRGFDAARQLNQLALKYGNVRDAERASADMQACLAAKSKISNALIAANATNALQFIDGGCQGPYPK